MNSQISRLTDKTGWNRISIKFPLLGIVMIGLSLGVLAWLLYQDTRSDLEKGISRELVGVAVTGALMIDPDAHEDIFSYEEGEIEGKEAFDNIKKTLQEIQTTNHLTKPVYTLRKALDFDETREMEFVVMTNLDGSGRPYVGNRIAITPYVEAVYQTSEPVATPLYMDSEGTWLSALAPIKDAEGEVVAVLSIDRDVDFFQEALARRRSDILGTAAVSLLVGGILFFLSTMPIVRRIYRLTRGTEKVSAGDLDHRIEISSMDELGLLANSFNKMTQNLSDTLVSREALQQTEEKYRSIFENIVEGIYQTTPDGRYLSANPALAHIHGYDSPEALTSNLSDIGKQVYVDPNRRAEFVRLVEAHGSLSGFESQIYRKDGTTSWISENARAVRDPAGRVLYYEGTVQDITERKEAEEALRKSKEELEQANQQLKLNQAQLVQSEKMAGLGQLSAGVAHELNTPAGFVMSNVRTLGKYVLTFKQLLTEYRMLQEAVQAENAADQQQVMDRIEEIQGGVNLEFYLEDVDSLLEESEEGLGRVKEIVEGLRSFARTDEAELKEADINEGIETTLNMVWNELKYTCEVHKNLSELPSIRCYPGQLNQVFMNLMVNAAQAIEERGEVTIETEATESDIVVRISDTGKGISPENIPRLFDPFFTTKPVGKGTGLGLSISHGIIQKHRGTIEVESEVGVGTTFSVRLPIEGISDE